MYKWIFDSKWKRVKYVNVGEVTNNNYLGWKKPRRKEQYVTINPLTGEIEWYYYFINGEWIKKDSTGEEYPILPEEEEEGISEDTQKDNVDNNLDDNTTTEEKPIEED